MTTTSKYLKKFGAATANAVLPRIASGVVVVEVLPKEELRSKGGIILGAVDKTHKATAEDHRRALGLIIACGPLKDEDFSSDLKVGTLVLMPYSPLYLSEFPGLEEYTENTIALINAEDVLVSYDSIAAYEAARAVFNSADVG